MTRRAGRGRRPGTTTTREQILAAAGDEFARHGYDAATVRGIAARAKVDPAMIHHYFGSKERLFLTVIDAPFDPADYIGPALALPAEELGENLVRALLRAWDSPAGKIGLAMLRTALQNQRGSSLLLEFVLDRVIRPAVAKVEPRQDIAALRTGLVISQLGGLMVMRYIFRIEPLAHAEHDVVVALIGPTVQRYLTGELPPRDAPDAP